MNPVLCQRLTCLFDCPGADADAERPCELSAALLAGGVWQVPGARRQPRSEPATPIC